MSVARVSPGGSCTITDPTQQKSGPTMDEKKNTHTHTNIPACLRSRLV